MKESRYPMPTCQANLWTFRLFDRALVRDATYRAACCRFVRYADVDPP